MKTPQVTLRSRSWTRQGHGGLSTETNYEIYLNDVRLRGFSTHGDMSEGYWGSSAERHAREYAEAVSKTLGVSVLRVRMKD